MRKLMLVFSVTVLLAISAFGQSEYFQTTGSSLSSPRGFHCIFLQPLQAYMSSAKPKQTAGAAHGSSPTGANLEQVLSLLDKASAGFKTVQTNFVWDQYQSVIKDHDLQSGVMYFRRAGNNVEMAADIQKPAQKYVLFTGNELEVYLPKADQVTRYMVGKNRGDFEAYLVLGFGGRGSDLPKNFEVHYVGVENVEGKPTYKLELVPKAQKAKSMFRLVTLWIDQQTGMSLQQRFQENGEDYRLAKYTSILINKKLPDGAFKLKTTGKTKYITPNN